MKILGFLAVVGAFSWIALVRISVIKRTYRSLRQLGMTVKEMRASLASLQSPISELLLSASEKTDGETGMFFRSIKEDMSGLCEHSFSEIWQKNVHEHLSILPERDRNDLIALGVFLGRFDLEDQLDACDRYLLSSTESIREHETCLPEKIRLNLALCGAAAVFLCLLIL